MPTLREYLTKNLPAIVSRSPLGLRLRPLAQSALIPALGDKPLEELTPEAITAFGEARLKEPKKDGSPRSQSSVEQEMDALEQIVAHAQGSGTLGPAKAGSSAPRPSGPAGGIGGTAPGVRSKVKRGTQRGR